MTRAIAIGIGASAGVLLFSTPASAAVPGPRAGDAAVVGEPGTSRTLTEGGSATRFSLRLPTGASCPEDSTDGNYRVQSFLVPEGTDVAALRFQLEGPDVPGGWALYDTLTSPYSQEQTAQATSPGGPGQIINLPAFSFAVFPPGELPEGAYLIGIACTLANQTMRYWDTGLVLVSAPNDKPAAFRWTTSPDRSGGHGSSPAPTAGLVIAVAAVAAVGWTLRRRSRSAPAVRVDAR